MISLIDFALKTSNGVDVDSKADYDMKLGGFIVHFTISFISEIAYNEEDLKTMFSLQHDLFIDNLKTYKSIGLAMNMNARLLKVINGSFNKVNFDKSNNKTTLCFQIPFKMADFSNYPYVQIPDLKFLLNPEKCEAYIDRVPTAEQCFQKGFVMNNQESGNEGSIAQMSRDVLAPSLEVAKSSLKVVTKSSKKDNESSKTACFAAKTLLEEKVTTNREKSRMARTLCKITGSPEMRLENGNQESGSFIPNKPAVSQPKQSDDIEPTYSNVEDLPKLEIRKSISEQDPETKKVEESKEVHKDFKVASLTSRAMKVANALKLEDHSIKKRMEESKVESVPNLSVDMKNYKRRNSIKRKSLMSDLLARSQTLKMEPTDMSSLFRKPRKVSESNQELGEVNKRQGIVRKNLLKTITEGLE